ncbi:MAG TPA: hypothetical protein VFG12_05675, partial [Rhodopila sp.]|nr:hypothetical protein [Rhodopila sp.]
MRLRFFLAATLASLAIPPADAQIRLAVIDQPPSPAQVVSADVGTSTVPQAAPATPVRPVRPRIVRRVRRRPPPPAPKIGHLTLPSFDMTAPFSGGHTIATPTPDANPQAAPAPVVPVEEQTLAPASAAPAQQTPIQAPAPATADAPPALSRPSFTWIEPVANAPVPTILLRTAPDVGVAAFRAGSDILVVLDAPIDFRAPPVGLDAAFAQLTSHPTEDATVIRIPAASGTLSMAHSPRGWVVMEGAPAGTVAEIVPLLVRSGPVTTGIRFPAAGANRVVTVVNPQTGTRLLVGTQTATGQAVPNPWQQPKFDLLPTLQGIVVAAISDDMRLHADRDGFTLSTGLDTGGPIMQDAARLPSGAPIAAAMSLLFNIPNGTQDELAHDLQQRIRAASDAHLLARSESRLRVAETMLALGMDVEAQSVIDVAAAADPALMNT